MNERKGMNERFQSEKQMHEHEVFQILGRVFENLIVCTCWFSYTS